MTTFRNLAATLVCSVAALAVTASAFAQAQFRDEKTGKVWTPDNVSKDNQLRPSSEPSTPADRAFDPRGADRHRDGRRGAAPERHPDGRRAHHGRADRADRCDR